MPPWWAGDEVYGRSWQLRRFCEDNQIGYVLRVGCAFHVQLTPALRMRADEAVARFTADDESWQVHSVTGSKGQRRYVWAWIATSSDRHFLLIHKHLGTGELAYHYCHTPPDRPITLPTLVQVACLQWPVEEDFYPNPEKTILDSASPKFDCIPYSSATSYSAWQPWPYARSPPHRSSPPDRTSRLPPSPG